MRATMELASADCPMEYFTALAIWVDRFVGTFPVMCVTVALKYIGFNIGLSQ